MAAADELRSKLVAALEPAHLSLQDTSDGCGSKFEAIIVSSKFEGVPLLERQQLVNSIIAEEMATIHAFSMKTWTPEQFAKKQAAASS